MNETGRGAASRMRALRYRLRTALASRGGRAFLLLLRLRPKYEGRLVDADTECVIEGFPRSGNTFSVAAFQEAQGRAVRLAHHTHAPAQVIRAVRLGVPVMLLVREPRDAVASWCVRESYVPARQGLSDYVRFHRRLEPYLDRCVVAPFGEVVTDFGRSIDRLNRRYGTDFAEFEPTAENLEACRRRVERSERVDSGGEIRETHVPRPSAAREERKRELIAQLEQPELRRELANAEALCRRFEEAANR